MNPKSSPSIVPASRPLRRFILATTIAPALFSTGAMAVDLVIPPERTISSDAGTVLFSEGLFEGFINNTGGIDTTTANPAQNGVVDRPRMGETNTKVIGSTNYWSDNQTWVYTGQVFDADGIFSFSENIDDRVRLNIDGNEVLNNDAWDVPAKSISSAGLDENDYGMGPAGDGWHDFEVRFQNGGGGAGTVDNAGLFWGGGDNATYNNMGFGYAINGADFGDTNGAFSAIDPSIPLNVIPIEIQDGTPQLFRVANGFGLNDDLIVTASGTLTIDGTTANVQEQSLRFDNAAAATFTINDGTGAHKLLSIANATQWATAASGGSAVTIAGTSDFQPGMMTDNGIAVTVTQAGPGTLILRSTAAHTLSNTTFVAAGGPISVSGTTDVVAGASFTVATASGQISFGGGGTFSNNITSAASGTISHSIATTDTLSGAINTAAAPLNFNVSAGALNLTGSVTGAGIVKDGGGAMTLTQPLTLTAATVNGGNFTTAATANITTATLNGGTYNVLGATTIGTATVTGGTLDAAAALTATTATISGGLVRARAAANFTDLTVSGGRLEVRGDVTITNQPTVSGDGTLALLSSAGSTISLPSPYTVNGGRVEIIPGSLGTPGGTANAVTLSGGTLALSAGVNGLSAEIYNSLPGLAASAIGGGDYNPDWGPDSLAQADVDFAMVTAVYDALRVGPDPRVITDTTTGGTMRLDFPDTQGAPFAVLGADYTDNIQTRFNGVFFAETAGDYNFGTRSDDGSVVFIDGVSVVNNNKYQGQTRRDGTATLTAGYHDIEIGFYERGGGAGITVFYTPPGGTDQIMGNDVLFQEVTGSMFDNAITATGGTIDVNSLGLSVTNLTTPNDATLAITGRALTVNTLNLTGINSTFNISNETTLLAVNDGGAAVNIVKTGPGDLVFDDPAAPQLQNAASTINVQGGAVGVVLAGVNQGIGNATLLFNGGGVVLSSKDGTGKNFIAPDFAAGGVLAARKIGSGIAGTPATPIAITVSNNLNIDAGNTLQLSTADNYVINIGGISTGGGTLAIGSGIVNASTATAVQPYNIVFNGVNGANPKAPGTLNVRANSVSLASLASVAGSGGSSLVIGDGTAPATLTLTGPAAGQTTRFTDAIAQNGQPLSVVANGAGKQVLGGVSTYSGGLTVNSGIVELAVGGAGTGPITLSGGTLQFSGSGLDLKVYNVNPDPAAYTGVLNSLPTALAYYAALPNLSLSTSTASDGNLGLDYTGGDGAPFGVHGNALVDDIQSIMTGQFVATTSGTYNFSTTSDDGSLLYLDGQLLVNNNGLHGDVTVSADTTLTAGDHNIVILFNERGGGANLRVNYTPPGGFQEIIPNIVLRNDTSFSGYAGDNAILVTTNSTLDLRDGSVTLGTLTQTAGTTLTVASGQVTFPSAVMADGATYNYAGAGAVALGAITDSGGAVTINRSGGGNLILSSPTTPHLQNAASAINVSGGSLVVGVFGGTNDPFGNASININGGGIGLSTADSFGTIDYTRPIAITGSGTISAGNFGGGAANGDPTFPILTTITQAPTVTAGNTLTVNSNSGYQLILGAGASGAGGLTASGGDVVAVGAIAMGESVNVTGGTLTSNGPLTANQLNISNGGILNAQGSVTATAGASIASKGELQLNGQAYSGGPIAIDEGTLRAVTGVNDLSGVNITIAPTIVTPTPNTLQGAYYGGTALAIATANGVNNLVPNATPGALVPITLGIEYPQDSDGALSALFDGADTVTGFTATFTGRYTANATGVHQFGINRNDDNDTIWLDLNQNGVFEDSELLVSVTCCGMNVVADVTLEAGQTYNFFTGVEDGQGGSGIVATFTQPGGVNAVIAPGAQPGVWSSDITTGGGTLSIADSARLNVGDVTNGTVLVEPGGVFQARRLTDLDRVFLTGGFALNGGLDNATLTLTGPGNSSIGTLTAAGAGVGDSSNVDIQSGVVLDVDRLTISGGLNKAGAGTMNVLDQTFSPGGLLTVAGGTVNLRGTNAGAPDPFGAPVAQADPGGTLNVTGAISGNVALNGGVLKGTGSVGNVSVLAGGILAPGDNLGMLSTRDVTLTSAATMQIELMDPTMLDQLNVTGALTLADANLSVATLWATAPAINSLFFIGLNDGNDAVGGTFANLPDGAQFAVGTGAAATSLRISYFGDSATNAFTGGNDIVLSVIPEPASLTSLVGGLGMLLGLRRMRRRS